MKAGRITQGVLLRLAQGVLGVDEANGLVKRGVGDAQRLAREVVRLEGRVHRAECSASAFPGLGAGPGGQVLVLGARIGLECAVPAVADAVVVVNMETMACAAMDSEGLGVMFAGMCEGGERVDPGALAGAVETAKQHLARVADDRQQELRAELLTLRSRKLRHLEKVFQERLLETNDTEDGEDSGGGQWLREKESVTSAIRSYFDPESITLRVDFAFLVLVTLNSAEADI